MLNLIWPQCTTRQTFISKEKSQEGEGYRNKVFWEKKRKIQKHAETIIILIKKRKEKYKRLTSDVIQEINLMMQFNLIKIENRKW